jgi:hypothetical protein
MVLSSPIYPCNCRCAQVWRQPQLFPLDWQAISALHDTPSAAAPHTQAARHPRSSLDTTCHLQRALTAIISGHPGCSDQAGDSPWHREGSRDVFNGAAGVLLHIPCPLPHTLVLLLRSAAQKLDSSMDYACLLPGSGSATAAPI